jgi:predicted unusual protein kinase regulating ubiquinone biosynthesis (AarF/ABC1/UbiB family)
MTGMRTGRAVRTLRLLSLPAGALVLAAEGVARRAAGQDPAEVSRRLRSRSSARTRRVLGELKGGALKAGQLLSTLEPLFPQDPEGTWREALTSLQEAAPALPFTEVEPVLAGALGPGWRARFTAFDERAAAAASLGQVHRAVWADGRPVAVKIQYPGVREALTADVRTVSAMTRVAALVAPGMALPPLVAELRDRLLEELDLEHEAAAQERFAQAYADDPDVVVPRVVLAAPRVLVMDWLDGTPLAQVAAQADQATRDRAGLLYQRFLVSGPERARLLHTDPHPGNFRLLDDGRLGVLDFGSTLALPGGMPETFGRLLRALLSDDPAEVLVRLRADGFVRPGADLDIRALTDYMGPFSVPARHESFRFTRTWLRGEFGRVNDPRNPDFAVALQLRLPAEHLFTHRVWLGMIGVLCALEAEVPVRPVLNRWLPGFDAGSAGL